MSNDDLTSMLVATVTDLAIDDVAVDACETAKRAILDVLACGVAGAADEAAIAVGGWVTSMGGRPDSTMVGTGGRAPAAMAALFNAVAAHALDYDDISTMMVHPSTTMVPALLAVGEQNHATGADLLAAYLAGFEVQARLCRAMNPEHYARGWHTTKTVGVLGTAMAVARLVGLDGAQSANALGIAAASASGLRKNFGTMVKPLHAGHAAMHGVEAVELARRGFTADQSVLQGQNGYFAVFSTPEAEAALVTAFAPGAPLEIERSGIGIKRFACCGAIHTALDAAEAIRERHAVRACDIVQIECRVNPMAPHILVHHHAATGLEGKFSVEYSLAAYFLHGRAGLEQFTDEQARDPELIRLMEATEFIVDSTLAVDRAYFPSVVTVELADGRRVSERRDVPRGYPEDPFDTVVVADKARDCCRKRLEPDAVERLIDTIAALEQCDDVSTIGSLLATEGLR